MYQPGTVSAIYLTLPQKSIDALNAEPDAYVEGTFSFAETNGTPAGIGAASAPITVGIRLKGQLGSKRSLAQKAAFKLKLNWVKGQKFRGLKKMTLNNMVQDPSEIHETLTYKLFREARVAAPRTGFAYVYVNGVDYGMHLNVETLDDVALEKRFGPFKHLYEGGYGSDVETGAADSPAEVSAAAARFEVDEGDEADRSDLEALIQGVNDPTAADFSTRVASLADLKEMTRMWAVEKYVGHWDGYAGQEGYYWPNNYYLFSDANGWFRMLPWGTDQTWSSRLGFSGDAGILFDKCLADPSCADEYRRSLRDLQGTVAGAGLDALAVSTASLLRPWEELEQGNGGHHEHGIGEIEGAVQGTRNFIAARPSDLTSYLGGQPQPGAAANVSLSLAPPSIAADGVATSTATATVTDASGNRIAGDSIAFTSSDPGETIGPVVDNDNGTYSVRVTASTTAGTASLTATDKSVTPSPSGSAALTQTAGAAAKVTVVAKPTSIPADGASSATVTAAISDANGNPLSGQTVTFASTDTGQTFGSVVDNGDGTYSVIVIASKAAGTATITATDGSAASGPSGSTQLTQTVLPATNIAVTLAPSTIPADGSSTATATATVTDALGAPVAGDAVSFSASDSGVRFSPVIDNGNGTYSATVTASGTAGTVVISAADGSVSPALTGAASLTQTAVQTVPPTVRITRAPGRITNERSPSFSFVGGSGAASFRCQVDSRPASACTSPFALPTLSYGLHRFSVNAVDAAGHVGPTVSYLFLVLPRFG